MRYPMMGFVALALACGSTDGEDGPEATGGTTSGDGGTSDQTGGSSGSGAAGSGAAGSGAAGSGAAGSGAAGSGGAGDDVPNPDTLFGACYRYVMAQCWRAAECGGQNTTYARERCEQAAISACPDAIFSDGSPHTIASALACAEVWLSYECQSLYDQQLPDCSAEPGSRTDGEPCIYQSQCEHECVVPEGQACGKCVPLSTDGTCSDDLGCRGISRCEEGQCVAAVTEPDKAPLPPQDQFPDAELGDPCSDFCLDGSVCALTDQDDDDSDLSCQMARTIGQACLRYYDSGFVQMRCGNELICAPDDTCQENGKSGEPCVEDIHGTLNCEYGTYCTIGDMCEKPQGPGEACVWSVDHDEEKCLEGQTCVSGTCLVVHSWGESGCDTNAHVCQSGTVCREDVCVVDSEEPREFAEACGD